LVDEVLLDIYQPIWQHPGACVPTLEAVQRRLSLMADNPHLAATRETAQLLAYTLSPYTTGSYGNLFNRQTTVDFSLNRLVTVYDVSHLPGQELGGNLRSALLAILVADVNQAIRNRRWSGDTAPILFFVDEMGVLMQDNVIADYIAREFKTARARNVGMIVADQDLHSFLGPINEKGVHNGAPILANAAFTLLFYQKDSERQRIRENFSGLPPALSELLFSLPRGACLAQLPDDLLVVHVRPSAFEQLVLSSRLADRQQAKAVVNRMIEELAG
jgi:type IV secretory pathway VirB4 component